MANLNSVCIMGRLVKDVDLRSTQSGTTVCGFTIACEGYGKEEKRVDFIDMVAWRHTAEFVAKYFKKGDPILIHGSLQTRQYKDKDGNSRKAVEVVANEVFFAGAKRAETAEEYVPLETSDDDLPF